MPRRQLHLSGDQGADALLTTTPLALVIGFVLDQQIPLEWAFRGPAELSRRLGGPLDAAALAAMDPETLAELFAAKPALHRYPGSMAARVQALCATVADGYGGDAARIWKGAADGEELLGRVAALPGFGPQKARIFVALLGKQLGVSAAGWREACAPFGEPGSFLSAADIVDAESLAKVREHKAQTKAAAKKAGDRATAPAPPAKQPAARPRAGARR
jgi:uncharacterized HhH-GPD family protein